MSDQDRDRNRKLVGQTIRRRREAKGLQPGTVAAAIGLTTKQYLRIEQGETSLRLDSLSAICCQLGVIPADLVREATFSEL